MSEVTVRHGLYGGFATETTAIYHVSYATADWFICIAGGVEELLTRTSLFMPGWAPATPNRNHAHRGKGSDKQPHECIEKAEGRIISSHLAPCRADLPASRPVDRRPGRAPMCSAASGAETSGRLMNYARDGRSSCRHICKTADM